MNDNKIGWFDSILQRWKAAIILIVILFQIIPFIRMEKKTFRAVEEYTCDISDSYDFQNDSNITESVVINAKPLELDIKFPKTSVGKEVFITVRQNEVVKEYKSIPDYDGLVYIDMNDEYHAGEMDITVNSDSVLLCNDLSLGSISDLDASLVLTVRYVDYIPFYAFRVAMFLLAVVSSIALTIVVLQASINKLILSVLSTIVLLSTIFSRFATTLFSGEPFYETAGLYINNIRLGGTEKLLENDAGYLPIFQRLVGIVVIKVFRLYTIAPLIYEMVAIGVVAGISLFWILGCKEVLNIRARCVAWYIIISGGLLFSHSQMLLFLNYTYYGAILLVLLYTTDVEKRFNSLILWFILCGLLVCSKGTFLIVAPFLLVVFFISLKNKAYKTAIMTFVIGFMVGVQLIYVLFYPEKESVISDTTLFEVFIKAVKVLFEVLQAIMIPGTRGMLLGMLVFVLFVYVLIRYYHKLILPFIIAFLCAFGQLFINEMGAGRSGRVLATDSLDFSYAKNVWFLILMIEMALVMLSFYQSNINRVAKIFFLLWFISVNIVVVPYEQNEMSQIGNWRIYSKQMEMDYYAIPGNYYNGINRFAEKGAFVVHIGKEQERLMQYSRGMYTPTEEQLNEQNCCSSVNAEIVQEQEVFAIYTSKSFSAQRSDIYCEVEDSEGNVLCRIKGISRNKTQALGFVFEEPLEGCWKMSFYNEQGQPVSVKNNFYIACKEK